MGSVITIAAALIAAFAAIVSVIISIFSFRNVKKSQRVTTYQHINDLYDKLISFRINHPELLSLSRKWTASKLKNVYRQTSEGDKQWARYYTYVELCIGYCNAVLYARKKKFLDEGAFENQHEPLMKLLLTEHNPIIEGMVKEIEYISKYVQEYRRDLEKNWNWKERYKEIDKFSSEGKQPTKQLPTDRSKFTT